MNREGRTYKRDGVVVLVVKSECLSASAAGSWRHSCLILDVEPGSKGERAGFRQGVVLSIDDVPRDRWDAGWKAFSG